LNIKEKIKTLPSSPGVYLMRDSLESIIYVGKSKNLRSRVSSYFQSSKHHSPKVVKLVKNIKNFDFLLTDTEFESYILECNLIKDIKPPYNRMMKNPSSYIYIKITGDYSKIETSDVASISDGNFYFGPFTSKNTVERALQGIKECLKIQCSNNFQSHSPCLNYSLGLCIGMCFDKSAKIKYLKIVDEIIDLLNGKDLTILNKMRLIMQQSAEKLDFDTAIKYRDYITTVNSIIKKEKIRAFSKDNKNISLLEYIDKNTFKFFLINGSKIIFAKKYEVLSYEIENLILDLRNTTLDIFSNTKLKHPIEIGRNDIDESQIIYSYLKTKQNNCKFIVIHDEWIENKAIVPLDEAIATLL
jgi:excinuclease ABC subunit C